jgi:hypothetical protein
MLPAEVAYSVQASWMIQFCTYLSGARGSLDDSAQQISILAVKACFVHLKTGVGREMYGNY